MRANLARRQLLLCGTLFAAALPVGSASAVQLSISSAQVAQPGGSAQLCVSLSTGGQEVAGTQNDLVWDGTCMTLNEGACSAAGSHGKQVNTRIQNSADFRMRVLVLSLSDVDPIDDGVLYCCNVQGEAPAGSCCSISVVNTGASDSAGKAVGGVGGNSGNLCTLGNSGGAVGSVGGASGSSGGSGGDSGNFGSGGSMGGSGATGGSGGSMGMGGGEAAGAGSGGGSVAGSGAGGGSVAQAPPANQVLQGGGAAPAPAANPAAPAVSVPGGAAAQVPTPYGLAATPAAPARPLAPAAPAAPAAAAPTAAAVPATAAAAGATPVAATVPPTPANTAPAVAPTAVPPTKAAASTATAARAAAVATAKSGWFGCQIDSGSSAAPALGLALLLGALARVRRQRTRQR